jgi:hypothetical protein
MRIPVIPWQFKVVPLFAVHRDVVSRLCKSNQGCLVYNFHSVPVIGWASACDCGSVFVFVVSHCVELDDQVAEPDVGTRYEAVFGKGLDNAASGNA